MASRCLEHAVWIAMHMLTCIHGLLAFAVFGFYEETGYNNTYINNQIIPYPNPVGSGGAQQAPLQSSLADGALHHISWWPMHQACSSFLQHASQNCTCTWHVPSSWILSPRCLCDMLFIKSSQSTLCIIAQEFVVNLMRSLAARRSETHHK